MDPECLLPASLSHPAPGTLRGLIDTVDPDAGLVGWALDLARPGQAVPLELMAGDVVLECRDTDRPREDLRAIRPEAGTPGFRFAPPGPQGWAGASPAALDGRLRVRVAGTDCFLPAQAPLPSAGEFAAQAGGRGQGAREEPDQAREIEEIARDPMEALQRIARSAERMLERPLVPAADRVAGFIEAVCRDQSGRVWLLGWMRRDCPPHFPALLSDATAFPAAVAVATYEREDLPEDASGMVAVVSTDWRPSGDGPGPRLFFGEAAERFLPSVDRCTVLSDAGCAARLAPIRESLSGPYAPALRRLLARTASRLPEASRAADPEVKAHVDRMLVLPGFGCLAEGWVLSPLQRVEELNLRVGGVVLEADAASTTRKSRPDLHGLAPGGHLMTRSAGFVTAFVGDARQHDLTEAALQLLLADGTTAEFEVSRSAVRVLGHSADYEDVLQLYPAMEGELFFPALARRIGEEVRRAAREVIAFQVRPARKVLAVAVPDDPHDLSLLLAELALIADHAGEAPPIALLARAGDHRANLLAGYRELSEEIEAPLSLFFVPDPAYAVHALGQVLDRLGAERFAYLGPGVFPTAAGWTALLDGLASGLDGPAALLVEGESGHPAPGQRIPAEGFVWDRRGFASWLAAQPLALGGPAAGLTLPAGAARLTEAAGARRGRRAVTSRFMQAVNRQLSKQAPEVRSA